MSTRVEKGGPKFKPVFKSKGRPSATPAPQDVRTRPSTEPGTSMPPPASIPERTPSLAPASSQPSTAPVASSSNVILPGPMPTRVVPVQLSRTVERTEEAAQNHKRKRSLTRDAEVDNNNHTEENDAPSEVIPKKRRRKGSAHVESAEPEGTPDPIDPTQITMSAICDDPGSGRVSSRWESSQLLYAEARKRAREERERAIADVHQAELETGRTGAKKGTSKSLLLSEGETANAEAGESVVENTGQNPDDFTYTESLKASHYAPQVRIGANGEVVLDMESLQVDRAADPEFREEAYSHVEESDQSRFTNSGSWSKRRVVRWGKEDTALFYDALRQFGQNFDLIARILPGRTYRMCRNKFKAEDKKHPGLIDDALKNSIAVDLGALSRMTGKDFTGPTPVIEAKKALTLGEDAPPQDARPINGTQCEAQAQAEGDDTSIS